MLEALVRFVKGKVVALWEDNELGYAIFIFFSFEFDSLSLEQDRSSPT